VERHTVICRAEGGPRSDPQAFATIHRTHTEDGWTWAPLDGMPFLLEAHVAALVERFKGIEPGHLPNITITTRSRGEVEAEPPVTVQMFGPFLDYAPAASISVLAPIHIDEKRDRFEMWSSCSRLAGRAGATGLLKFRVSTLVDQLLGEFNDGGNPRQAWTGPQYRQWAADLYRIHEIWVRPNWSLDDIAFLRNAATLFPPPKPLPVIDPAGLAHKAALDDLGRRRATADRVMRSRGFTPNTAGNGWTPPKDAA
jgi:hypothetical protein